MREPNHPPKGSIFPPLKRTIMTNDIFITGIGASAGGTAALKAFFENIPENPDTAFIVIQHLDRKQKGFTKEALSSSTSLPIIQVNGRTKIAKNHIYLIQLDYLLDPIY